MNKLEEYRESLLTEAAPFDHNENYANNMIRKGFDAAIALDLPVKYTKWKDSIFKGFISSEEQPEQWKRIEELFNKIGKGFTEEDLYKYWIDNIYKPE